MSALRRLAAIKDAGTPKGTMPKARGEVPGQLREDPRDAAAGCRQCGAYGSMITKFLKHPCPQVWRSASARRRIEKLLRWGTPMDGQMV